MILTEQQRKCSDGRKSNRRGVHDSRHCWLRFGLLGAHDKRRKQKKIRKENTMGNHQVRVIFNEGVSSSVVDEIVDVITEKLVEKDVTAIIFAIVASGDNTKTSGEEGDEQA